MAVYGLPLTCPSRFRLKKQRNMVIIFNSKLTAAGHTLTDLFFGQKNTPSSKRSQLS